LETRHILDLFTVLKKISDNMASGALLPAEALLEQAYTILPFPCHVLTAIRRKNHSSRMSLWNKPSPQIEAAEAARKQNEEKLWNEMMML